MVLLSGLAGAAGAAAGLLTKGFLLTLTKLSIGPLVLNGFLLGGMFFFGGGTLLGGYSLGAPGRSLRRTDDRTFGRRFLENEGQYRPRYATPCLAWQEG